MTTSTINTATATEARQSPLYQVEIETIDSVRSSYSTYFRCHPNDSPERVAEIVACNRLGGSRPSPEGGYVATYFGRSRSKVRGFMLSHGTARYWETPKNLDRRWFNLVTRGKVASLNPDEIYGPVTSKNVVFSLNSQRTLRCVYVSALPCLLKEEITQVIHAIGGSSIMVLCDRPVQLNPVLLQLNQDMDERDRIIWGDDFVPTYCGGIAHYTDLTLEQLEQLVAQNFIDLDERQNSAPSVGDILEFIRANPKFTAHGYAIDLTRSDYRVSIEGIQLLGKYALDEVHEFASFVSDADDLVVEPNNLYAWWD